MSGSASTMVTFTVVGYDASRAAWGALHMATQRRALESTPGLRFWKLLGTGSGIGFSAVPDLTSWALLGVWENARAWQAFRDDSQVMRQYSARGRERYTLLLDPISAHGQWDGREPFCAGAGPSQDEGPVVVLTRAAIRLRRQLAFWRAVPSIDRTLHGHPDLLLTFGVGEMPYLRQATLSVWRSEEAMCRWAYEGSHRDVIRRTREEGWYAEELFARFRLRGAEGSLHGSNPLAGL